MKPPTTPILPGLPAFVLVLAFAGSVAAQGPRVLVATARQAEFPLTVEALGTARANESVEIRPKIAETTTAGRRGRLTERRRTPHRSGRFRKRSGAPARA